MKLLLDTHVLLALVDPGIAQLSSTMRERLADEDSENFISVASLWEIAIKSRLRKLALKPNLETLPELILDMQIAIVPINEYHVLTEIDPQPKTNDPFDRLLLAQCLIDGMRLVSVDRHLKHHPLAADFG